MSGWRATLRPASFRGVRFYVNDQNREGGRRWADHEYPARDTPFAEDLGRRQRVWRFTGYVIGDNYPAQRDRLIEACEERGPGELVHPTYGTVQVACRVYAATEEQERGRFCSLAFEFAEAGSVREPDQTGDHNVATELAADQLGQVAIPNFSGGAFGIGGGGVNLIGAQNPPVQIAEHGFTVAGGGPWVTQAAIDDVLNLAQALEALRLPGPGLPQGPLVEALAYLNRNAGSLVGNPPQLAAAIDQAFGSFTDAGEAGPVVGAMLTMAAEWQAGAPAGTGGRPIQPVHYAAANSAAAYITPRQQRAQNAALFERLVRELALREVGYSATGMEFDNYDEAIAQRDVIVRVFIEAICADVGEDDIFSALAGLRGAITRMIGGRAADLNPLITYRAYAIPNSLTLAWRMYQDADRDLEICDRVSARNPGFLPMTGRILAGEPPDQVGGRL